MTTYLGDKAVGIGTIKATKAVAGDVLHDETLVGNGNTEPLGVDKQVIATTNQVGNLATTLYAAIEAQAEAIQKTREDSVKKSGDTMTGDLVLDGHGASGVGPEIKFVGLGSNPSYGKEYMTTISTFRGSGFSIKDYVNGDLRNVLNFSDGFWGYSYINDKMLNSGTTLYPWKTTYTQVLNAGNRVVGGASEFSGDLIVPFEGGTLARIEDLNDVRADMNEKDSELEHMITEHAEELTTLRGNQAALGDQVSNIESKIPESASETNPLVTKQQLLDEEMDIRDDLNESVGELQTQITAQAGEIAKLDSEKIDKNQGTINAGKYLMVGDDGIVGLTESGGGGGIANVIHDSTLNGKGTDDEPLGVAKNLEVEELTVGTDEGTLNLSITAGVATIATNNGLDIVSQTKFDTAPTTDDNTTWENALDTSLVRKAQVAKATTDAISAHNTATNAHSNIRGVAGGLATLDNNAKVPMSQINDALIGNVSYQGLWNAETNTPFLADPTGGLPTGYKALGYIDFTSSSYIDTGVFIDETDETVEYDIKMTPANTGNFPFGAAGAAASDNNTGSLFFNSGTIEYFAGDTRGIRLGEVITGKDYLINIKLDQTTQTVTVIENDLRTSQSYAGSIIAPVPIILGGLYYGTPDSPIRNFNYVGKIYYFIIRKNGQTVKQYQPAQRISDGAYGFYEQVSGEFVVSTGASFASGGGEIEIPKGYYYITTVAGDRFGLHFDVGDWIISAGGYWSKVDNTDAVSAVNGMTGNVVLNANDVGAYTKEEVDALVDGRDDLPDQTGNAGKFLTTDGTEASWSDKPLVNNAGTASGIGIGKNIDVKSGIGIGLSVKVDNINNSLTGRAVAIGAAAEASTSYGSHSDIAIGQLAKANGSYSIAIGARGTTATAQYAIQLGSAGTNNDANTFKVANSNGNFEMMSADGTIPADRMSTTAGTTGQVLTKTDTGMGWSDVSSTRIIFREWE